MTRLINDPSAFADEMLEGFAAAASRWVRSVPGGVVRATREPQATVAVVVVGGGRRGMALAGLVGPGIAHGAAVGDPGASGATQQACSVATTADQGRGVLLSCVDDARDVRTVTEAQDRLRAEGHDVRIVVIPDDVADAPVDRVQESRGIAGALAVVKLAGAAAEAGASLDDVERIAITANERTRSCHVAFPGPPSSTVDRSEPGASETDVPSAAELAERFVSTQLERAPEGVVIEGARVVPLLDGLGSASYDELLVVYGAVHRLLEARGIVIVEPDIVESRGSSDAAGCSLTLVWLDDELEELWTKPADTPAYRKGSVVPRQRAEVAAAGGRASEEVPESTDASKAVAQTIAIAFVEIANAIDGAADELGRLDAAAGDGDHGIAMQRGVHAARDAANAALEAGAGAETTLHRAAEAWHHRVGGASGAVWSAMLRAVGAVIGDVAEVSRAEIVAGVDAARDAVVAFGSAKVGDKTMIDAVVPFADELRERVAAGDSVIEAWSHAAGVAEEAAQETAALTATLGLATSREDGAIGTPDPGAVSFAIIVMTVAEVLAQNLEADAP